MKISLALSCGTALGFCHIGVIRYLEEHNIEIAALSGCSIGSWIGAMYASGMNSHQIEETACTIIDNNIFRHADLSFNTKGIFKGEKIHRLLQQIFNNKEFSDCCVPFYIVASNAMDGTKKILNTGPLANAVRASISVPGIFRPWVVDNTLCMDGGVGYPLDIENLPDKYPILGSIALGRPQKFYRFPSMYHQLFRNQTQLNIKLSESICRDADYVVQPEFQGIFQWNFKKIGVIIQKGYDETKKILNPL